MRPTVALNRRYDLVRSTSDEIEIDRTQYAVAHMLGQEPGMGMDELLRKGLTIVLGEARSGKTTEFVCATDRLNESGKCAFFVRIEDLAGGGGAPLDTLRFSLEGDRALGRFDSWLAREDEAVFFLDAVDEAKLRHPSDYRRAVHLFQQAIQPHLARVRVVISCRVSEWRPKDDLDVVAALQGRLAPDVAEPEEQAAVQAGQGAEKLPQIVTLRPLGEEEIHALASSLRVDLPADFFRQMEHAGVLDFAGRPGDALELIRYWHERGSFGSLTDLVGHDVERKLREENDAFRGQDVLSPAKALKGAEALAAAAVMCNAPTFRVAPPEQDGPGALPALDPAVLLPDWQPNELQALLRYPLFDEATYGRVRFHTRTVREYLAAQWFLHRINDGCPPDEVVGLFFPTIYGQRTVAASRSVVAAWLAPDVPKILAAALTYHPEILPDAGDPQRLPVAVRERVLEAHCRKYKDRFGRWFHWDASGMRRFAHPELCPCVGQLLLDDAVGEPEKDMLLDLVAWGGTHMSGCAAAVMALVEDEHCPWDLRCSALLAVAATGTRDHKERAIQVAYASPAPYDRYISYLLHAFYPDPLGAEGVVGLLQFMGLELVGHRDQKWEAVRRIIKQIDDPQSMMIIAFGLRDKIVQYEADDIKRICSDRVSENIWTCFGLSVEKLVRLDSNPSKELFQLLDAVGNINVLSEYYGDEVVESIKESLHAACFTWRRGSVHFYYAWRKRKDSDEYIKFRSYYPGFPFALTRDDAVWLIEDCESEEDAAKKLFLVSVLLKLWSGPEDDENDDQLDILCGLSSAYESLLSDVEALVILREERLSGAVLHPWELKSWVRQLADTHEELKFYQHVKKSTKEIASGKAYDIIGILSKKIKWYEHRVGSHSLRPLIELYGEEVADAFKTALIRSWKNDWKPDWTKNVFYHWAVIGASLAFEDGFDVSEMAPEQIKNAVRLAFSVVEMPVWMDLLCEYHPEQVASTLREMLDEECIRQGNIPHYPVIRTVCSQAQLFRMVASDVMACLEKYLPEDGSAYQGSCPQLLGLGYQERLSALFATKAKAVAAEMTALPKWVARWLQLDATAAWAFIEEVLGKMSVEEADAFVLDLAAGFDPLHRGQYLLCHEPDYQNNPVVLTKMIKTVCWHVRPIEDIHHESAYSPGARDFAQSFRGKLFEYLEATSGKESYIELCRLVEELPEKREYLQLLVYRKLMRDADVPWQPSAIPQFEREHEIDPLTTGDLFAVAIKRLREIQGELERGDFSNRGLFTENTAETELQKYFAGKLQDKARGRYAVVREAEVDAGKKPDIRLVHEGTSPVSIEMKWAHKWSLSKLEVALANQLVGQYLKADGSSYGIFLLVNAKEGEHWGGKREHTFQTLIEHLQSKADAILASNPEVQGLVVFGIDVTPPAK
ncbi:MAG: hypothetical protein AB7E47_00435 [Desulfovibrionaceae bacterium]